MSVDGTETDDEIIAKVQNVTKEIMKDDELLTDDNPQVEKVKYWEEDEDDEIVVPPITDTPVAEDGSGVPAIAAASAGLLALILGALLLKKKKREIAKKPAIICPPAAGNSFEGADAAQLGKHASCMDVHECKSAVCPKCYAGRSIMFVEAPQCKCPPPARTFEEVPHGWLNKPSLESSSFESSSTTEFYS